MIKLWKLLFESRVSDFKKKYETLPDDVKNRLIQNDPSSNYRYLDWMGKIAVTEPRVSVNDLVKDVNEFDKLRASLGDIYKLKNYGDLKHALSSRVKGRKAATKEDAEVLIDNDEFLVVAPTTHDSCRYFGTNTRWCITGQEKWWNHYYYDSTIIIVLDKRNNQKYAVISKPDYGDADVYDKNDHNLNYSAFMGEEEDSWPEYVHDAIAEYQSGDDVERRRSKWHEQLVDLFVKEVTLDKIWENYLEAVHINNKINVPVSISAFKTIANNNGIPDGTLDRYATSYLYYKLQEGMDEGIEEDIESLGDMHDDSTLDNALREMGEYEWVGGNAKSYEVGRVTLLEKSKKDYYFSIKGTDVYLKIIEDAIGPDEYRKLVTIDNDLVDAISKYNTMLNTNQQLTLKGLETDNQSVRITNIRDIIHVFKRTGYEGIGHYLESLLGIVVEDTIKITPMLKEDRDKSINRGCLMAMVPKSKSQKLAVFGNKLIRDENLYIEGTEYGRETESHVTILYGFLPDLNELEIRRIIKDIKPFSITLTSIDIFDSNPNYDVVKFNVESSVLRELNKRAAQYPHDSKFPDYKPHMTIAYVLKGRFKPARLGMNINIPINEICYSPAYGGNKSYFDLD